jgi:hypothetical protein
MLLEQRNESGSVWWGHTELFAVDRDNLTTDPIICNKGFCRNSTLVLLCSSDSDAQIHERRLDA